MRKHISEVELCDNAKPGHWFGSTCGNYHQDDFCLLCGYELEGDRLYMEIHGSNGASNAVRQIDSAQPYVCMECVSDFETYTLSRKINAFTMRLRCKECLEEAK